MADGYTQRYQEPEIVAKVDDLPPHARIEVVRPRRDGQKVIATLATVDGEVMSAGSEPLRYRAGEHYLTEYPSGDRGVVRKDIFEKSYRRAGPGVFKKRHNLRLRACIADQEMQVATLEGVQTAHRGDWIMIGVADELWPVSAHDAREKYRPASAIGWTGVSTTVALVFLLLAFVALFAR